MLLAAVMYTNNEQVGFEGCPIPDPNPDGSPPTPIQKPCTLGNLASYVVNATTVDQVAASVKFAAKHNLRFRVKNSGHDYSGKSTGAGAFTVWTYYLQDIQLIRNFVPTNCKPSTVNPYDVFSAGSGVNVGGLVNASAQFVRISIGGYTSTVGAMGGFALGGGFGETVIQPRSLPELTQIVAGPLHPDIGAAVDSAFKRA